MTDGDRLRALLARTAEAGAAEQVAVGLRAVLERLDATVLPRCLSIAAGDVVLALSVMERRVLAVGGIDGLDAPDAAARVGALLARHLGFDPTPRLSESPLSPDAARDPSRGLSARAIAAALGVALWPDRSLAGRLQAWAAAVHPQAATAVGYGLLADADVGWGDAAAVVAALARYAPGGPEALVARALDGPAGGVAGEAAPGLVVLAGEDGPALLVAGSPEGGIAVLADLSDVPDLVRAWQTG